VLAQCKGDELRYFCRKMQRLVQLSSDETAAKLRMFRVEEYGGVDPDPYSPRECVVGRNQDLGRRWRQALNQPGVETTEHVVDLKFGGTDSAPNYVGLTRACNNTIDEYLTTLLREYGTDGASGQPFTNVNQCVGTKLKFESSNGLRDFCDQQFGVRIP
jgi:hypothetical protein